MHIVISGQDRTSDLGAELRQAGRDMTLGNPAELITPEVRLLAWQLTGSQTEYDIWIERLVQCSLNDDRATAPRLPRPGRAGALLLRTHVLIRKLQKGWRHGLRPPVLSTEIGALTLGQAASETDFNERFIRLLKYRDNVDSSPFLMPRKPGLAGAVMARLRIFLWQLLRFLVDRIAFRQNHINGQLTRALEFEHEERRRETEALKKRLAELEARLK